jgi:asparagine synthetase B (glutamine-hydrolysing)
MGADEAASALRASILEAVEDSLRDAKRPGVLLSGGLDSSIVAVAASAAWRRLGRDPQDLRLHHSLPVEGEGEVAHARAVAEHLRLPLHLRRAGWADPYEGTEDCLRRMPVPVDDGGVSDLLDIARTLRDDGVDVVLTGEGGDEAFNGYWFRPWRRASLVGTALAAAEHAARAVARPVRDALLGRDGALRRRARRSGLPSDLLAQAPVYESGLDYPPARVGLTGARARRDRMCRTGRVLLCVSTLRAVSESVGVQTRFPLLHARVLDTVASLDPARFLTSRDGSDKWVARRAFATELPSTAVQRPKWSHSGVPTQQAWQADRMRAWYERYVAQGPLERGGLVSPDTARQILDGAAEGTLAGHWRARALLSLGAWCAARGLRTR